MPDNMSTQENTTLTQVNSPWKRIRFRTASTRNRHSPCILRKLSASGITDMTNLFSSYTVPTLPSISVPVPHTADGLYPPSNGSRGLSRSPGADEQVRVLTARPKPQCFEHGCNGRQFSTFSNLLRHQREKSGTATKSYCPRCNAEFTRTTARNGHMQHEKCKSRTDA